MNVIEHLLSKIDTEKTYTTISDIKANSILSACDIDHSQKTASYLCLGKNLVAYGLDNMGYNVVSMHGLDQPFKNGGDKLQSSLDELVASGTKYDYVIAADEWLVQSESEQQQLEKISQISQIANIGFYTTLKDYKNMNASNRFFEEPFQVKTNLGESFIIRKRDWDKQDRQAWIQRSYVIEDDHLVVGDPVACRTMYFKQLAKFITDAGAKNYQVEKKNMYKPLFSKSFEYIIYVNF